MTFSLIKPKSTSNKTGHVKAIVSSLQDVSNSNARSPVTTPIMGRKMNNSFRKQRKLVKQSSLQNPIGGYNDEKESYPIYDSPPRFSDFLEYSSIPSQSSTTNANKSHIERRPSLQKKQPGNCVQFSQQHPQQSMSANSSPNIGKIHKRNTNCIQVRQYLSLSIY